MLAHSLAPHANTDACPSDPDCPVERGTLVEVLTLWASITQADGSASRPSFSRVPVREVAALHAGAVHIQDRVHDVAQIVLGRQAEVQGPAAADLSLATWSSGIWMRRHGNAPRRRVLSSPAGS